LALPAVGTGLPEAAIANYPIGTGRGMRRNGDMAMEPDVITLAIDVGGTHLKAGLLDGTGRFVAGPGRVATPQPAPPEEVLAALQGIITPLGAFARVSVGFPGVVRHGKVYTAPNLGTEAWAGFGLADALTHRLGRPVRVLNDAEVQGLGVISGVGLEMVVTLGTGFGFALFHDGGLTPHLEMSHHIARGKKTYDQYLGNAARTSIGRKRWNRRVTRAIAAMATLANFDTLYIGGGNAKFLDLPLPANVHIVPNTAGITGGVKLWDARFDSFFQPAADPSARPLALVSRT
jgi:polyphosphate glucokinase